MPSLSPEARRSLRQRSQTLDELLGSDSCGLEDPAEIEELLRSWQTAVAPGDETSFRRRLAFDGLSPERLRERLARVPPGPAGAAPWLDELDAVLGRAEALAGRPDASVAALGLSRDIPFSELWSPFLVEAREGLRAALDPAALELLAACEPELESRLLGELTRSGERAAWEWYSGFREDARAAGLSEGIYALFARGALEGGLGTWLVEHSVLARDLVALSRLWRESSAELLRRYLADRKEIDECFPGSTGRGGLAAVEPGLSDRHRGGRQVARLRFASGFSLIYKPRPLGLEAELGRLGDWLAARGLAPAPSFPRILERGEYGWVEDLAPAELADLSRIEAYYRGAGGLAFLAWIARARDLHLENLIAGPRSPVPIDAEASLQPVERRTGEPDDPAFAALSESVLGSGLVTFLQGETEIGGLLGASGEGDPATRRRWLGVGRDELEPVDPPARIPLRHNRPRLAGQPVGPEGHAAQLLAGFESAGRVVMQLAGELLAVPGPLEGFRGRQARVVLRPSQVYSTLLEVLAQPRFQRRGWARSVAIDTLNRQLARASTRPPLWALTGGERRSLEGLDVPHFRAEADGISLRGPDGSEAEGVIERSGLEAVRERLRGLDEEGLAEQSALLAVALAPAHGGPAVASPDLLGAARDIGRELLERPEAASGGSLYEGRLGVALFLAALHDATGEVEWRRAALRGLDAEPAAGQGGIGLLQGAGGAAWAWLQLSRLLDAPELLERAARLAAGIDRRRIESEPCLDLADGLAGALVALLELHSATGDPALLERAGLCAERLLGKAVETGPQARAWSSPEGVALLGFAHGAAGIACALARLYRLSGDPRLLEAARAGLRHEAAFFSAPERNWPVLRRAADGQLEPAVSLVAWCHGAPGIGLGRVLALDVLNQDDEPAELLIAMATTRSAPPAAADHLCCGNLGRALILAEVGQRTGRPELVGEGRALAQRVVAGARRRGFYRLGGGPFARALRPPGLFRGLAGIGWGLLAMHAPGRLPSLLGFAAAEPREDVQVRPLVPAMAGVVAAMTFPAYRHLLDLSAQPRHAAPEDVKPVQPFGVVLEVDGQVRGLALGEVALEESGPGEHARAEILSLFLQPEARGRGLCRRLIEGLSEESRHRGARRLEAVYMTGRPEIDRLERAFARLGFEPPRARTVTLRFTPEQALATPWFGRVRLGPGYTVFPWSELGQGERQELRDSQAEAAWIFPALEPWRHDEHGFDEVSSLGLRYQGRVVGWVINHRIAPDTVRFTCSFMRKDLGRRGRILPLYTESLRRLRGTPCRVCTFVTPIFYRSMVDFVRERCAPWAEFFGETRGCGLDLAANSGPTHRLS